MLWVFQTCCIFRYICVFLTGNFAAVLLDAIDVSYTSNMKCLRHFETHRRSLCTGFLTISEQISTFHGNDAV